MAEVKHTPGPWELVSLSGYGAPFSIRMPYIATTANVGQTHYGVQSVRRREDAILIAATPDLFEALEVLVAHTDGLALPTTAQAARLKALAALSKATAQQEGR